MFVVMSWLPFPVKFTPRGQPKNQHQLSACTTQQQQNQRISTPQWPLDNSHTTRQLSATLDFQGSTVQELSHWLKLTLDIYTLDINIFDIGYLHCKHLDIGKNQHQLPPPGSSTNSASASSLHHQAAAPHQPASRKTSSQPAVNSTTLPHPHHGSQVCCCLDILWLYSPIVF